MQTNSRQRLLDRLRGRPVVWRPLEVYGERLRAIERLGLDLRDAGNDRLREQGRALFRRVRESGKEPESILEEGFALTREVAHRVLGLRPYDVQVIAGLAMFDGRLVELATGEGKTLAAVAPAYLHALSGHGSHMLTFNDYLARRDAAWMGPVYEFLGLDVGVIQEEMSPEERRQAYACDVTYATAKEVGFDLLRNRLANEPAEVVQRPFGYAIADEADSILIDEARVPLVIAGTLDEALDAPARFAELARELRRGEHYALTENARNVNLTNAGIDFVQQRLGIADLLAVDQADTVTTINSALHAEALLERDVDYLVRRGRIELIDEFTGRVVEDRHLPDGLQAAVEAKEGLAGGHAGTILGNLTLQHMMARYTRLAGMTATAYTSCDELKEFYGLTTVAVPPNRPSVREDHRDRVFVTRVDKERALVEEISSAHRNRRPVLVGTASVAESEHLGSLLDDAGVPHRVLNARNDEEEAAIVADAGAPGAVTISTNMAGRGTDIRLGGADESDYETVVALGGLYVIGTNRHESRRIDDQLRGRAGRQGDPGSTCFFVSLDDPLFDRFELMARVPPRMRPVAGSGDAHGEYDDPIVLDELERTQRIVDGQNGDIRRTLSRYSDMIEQQREQLDERREGMLHRRAPSLLAERSERYGEIVRDRGEAFAEEVERRLTLAMIDRAWRDHLAFVTELRDAIHLRNVARLDPLAEFQKEVIQAFADLMPRLDTEIVETFESATIGPEGIDLDALGLRAPSSTWTYIVSDDPFQDQLLTKIGGTAMGFGIVVNLWFVLPWWLYRRWLRHRRDRRER